MQVDTFRVLDCTHCISVDIAQDLLEEPEFNLIEWFGSQLLEIDCQEFQATLSSTEYQHQITENENRNQPTIAQSSSLSLARVQVDHRNYPQLQRNVLSIKGDTRILPKLVVLQVRINRHPAQALVDTRSLGDFMSSTLANQLKVKRKILGTPLGLQLAVQGSQSKINTTTEAQFQYQGIDLMRHFNIINLNSYDIILGTLGLYQHKVCISLNPAQIVIRQDNLDLIQQGQDTKLMVHTLGISELLVEVARMALAAGRTTLLGC